ncbi:MAG: hypothetical protein LAQ30_25000 [Acidobacteriia bacterium]|nr:hypothetical protein [Terriglobia bacterium]
MWRLIVALAALAPATAQERAEPPGRREALQWAVGLADRFSKFHEPVIAIYATARLGTVVCPDDPAQGSLLFRDAVRGIKSLSSRAFSGSAPLLPVASFSGLWNYVSRNGLRCDPGLSQYLDNAGVQRRLGEERRAANDRILEATDLIVKKDEPDRAARTAAGAFEAADPDRFDMETASEFLSGLRGRAPDLADDLFPKALDLIVSSPAPSLAQFMQLGQYLFTAPQWLQADDAQHKTGTVTINGRTYPDLTVARSGANPDDIQAYMEAAIQFVENTANPAYDAGYAEALARAMRGVAVAFDYPPETIDALTAALSRLAPGTSLTPDQPPDFSELGRTSLARVMQALAAGRFPEARALRSQVDDGGVRQELAYLIDFAEAAQAVRKKDFALAMSLANRQRAGIKRALLYASVVSAAGRDLALEALQLAGKDSQLLPAEQRACVLSALASAAMPVDSMSGFMELDALVTALNDARANPRRGRYAPASIRAAYSGRVDTSTDSALIVCGSRGAYETVDATTERRSFPLRAPGADAFTLPAFLRKIRGAPDYARLEAHVLSVREETQLAVALAALAEVRFRK